MALGAVGSTVLGLSLSRLGVGVVKVDSTAINLLTLHGLVGLGSRLGVGEVDITEATAAASVLVGDDASTDEVTERLESLVEGIVINTPAERASEQGGGGVISLGLLGGLVDLLLSLALLGGSGLSLLLLIGVRVIAVVGVILRVGIL